MTRNLAAWWIASGFLIAIGTGVAVAMGFISSTHLAQNIPDIQSLMEKQRDRIGSLINAPDKSPKDITPPILSILQEDQQSLVGNRKKLPASKSVKTVRIQNSDYSTPVFEPVTSMRETIARTNPQEFSPVKNPQNDELKTGTAIEPEKPTAKSPGEIQPTPKTDVRLYVDGKPVELNGGKAGETAEPKGPLNISAGEHIIRLDLIEQSTGKTLARTDVPIFQKSGEPQRPIDGVSRIMIREGETLWSIAERRYGSGEQYRRIFEANRAIMPSPDLVEPGQVLELPE